MSKIARVIAMGRRLAAVAAPALAMAVVLVAGAPEAARAQSSTQRSIQVPFAAAMSDGYAAGSVTVQYAFLACYGELHLALRLAPGSARSNGVYRMAGKTYQAEGAPRISVVKVRGRAARAGAEIIGSFTNGAVGPDGGLGCFSGDLTQLGVLTDWLGPKPTPQQIVNFLNSLSLTVEPLEAVRDAGLEARLRAEDRQRQAAVEAQQKTQQEAAEARRQAEARRAQEAARPVSRTPTGAGGGYAEAARPAAPSEPTREQRIADAIASDRRLAEQRLVEQQAQRRAFEQQMAANHAEQQRQNEAIIAAAPALMDLGAGLEDMINGPYHRAKERSFRAAQAQLAGKCFLPNGKPAPRNGEIQFGVPISSRLEKTDCGYSATGRFKAYLLVVETEGRATFSLTSGYGVRAGQYRLLVADLEGRTQMEIDGDEYGLLQKTFVRSVSLTPGTYVVRVSNTYEYDFLTFRLHVDFTDAHGRKVAAAAPPPSAAAEIKPVVPGYTASTPAAPAAPPKRGVVGFSQMMAGGAASKPQPASGP